MCGPFVMACAAEGGCYRAPGDEKTAASQGGRSAICWRDTASTMAPPQGELAVITKDISYRPGLG